MKAVLILEDIDQAHLLSIVEKVQASDIKVSKAEFDWMEKVALYYSTTEDRFIEP